MERIFVRWRVLFLLPAVLWNRAEKRTQPSPSRFPGTEDGCVCYVTEKWYDSYLAVSPLLRCFCFHGGVIKSEMVVFCRVPKAKIRFLVLISKT